MSRMHDIDNREHEPLFQFDSYEDAEARDHLEDQARTLPSSPSCIAVLSAQLSALNPPSGPSLTFSVRSSSTMEHATMTDAKGKGISRPVDITSREVLDVGSPEDDLFSMSLGTVAHDPALHSFPSVPSLHDHQPTGTPMTDSIQHQDADLDEPSAGSDAVQMQGKGKGRELPPTLPPLSFVTTELNYESSDWPVFDISTSVPGPSSYNSGFGSVQDPQPSPGGSAASEEHISAFPVPAEDSITIARIPSRRRSMSNLSVHSRRSISAMSLTKPKAKPVDAKAPGNLARKLLFKKRDVPDSPTTPSADVVVDQDVPGCAEIGQASCFTPWTCDNKPRTSSVAIPVLDIDFKLDKLPEQPSFYVVGRPSDNSLLRTKGRSYSSPLPLPTTLDLVPVISTADIFSPILLPTPNRFDEKLPDELKLHVFVSLVELHEADHDRQVRDGKWSLRKATSSKNRWVGRDRGVRELFKLSRVSKSWRTLVFDGQLWAKLDLRSFPVVPPAVLVQLSEVAGSFIRHIDFTGHADLSAETLLETTPNLCVAPVPGDGLANTHLTSINLHGCTALTTHSVHYLLRRSPSLRSLCLKGLTAVTNTTCDVLAEFCPQIVSLDLSRCRNMTGDGIYFLATAVLARKEPLALKELRLCGLRRVSDDMMRVLGKAAPYLEVLDLSYARDLHNSGVEAFVACSAPDSATVEAVQLTAREAGRDPTDPEMYWRRVTRLRHLSLSSCIMLTDHACSHLAHAVPKLELLELAGIGTELRDSGLVRLLNTTPYIRRLDLEDASEITDDVLLAITPDPVEEPARPTRIPPPPQPGHVLEHLVISYASEVTAQAMLDLIAYCPRLCRFEADNTRMSGHVVREFVRLARERHVLDAQVVAVDCRGVGEQTVRDLADRTRPRIGWRAFDVRRLGFLDARDEEELGVGQDECDPARVALKTFYSWQTVDAVRAARDKKRKASRRTANVSSSSMEDSAGASAGRARWWSPSGRRSSGMPSPVVMDMSNDREGCAIM